MDECHLARPFRLALRWVAGREIPRHQVSDAAVEYLMRVGLVREERSTTSLTGAYNSLLLTEAGQRALAAIEDRP